MPHSATVKTSLCFVALAGLCLIFADLAVITLDPWRELANMAVGFVMPSLTGVDSLVDALIKTLAFALLGVAAGAIVGFGLALIFHFRIVRVGCAFVRAIHELFWALIFLQAIGLHPLSGLLAIAIPYAGIFAKVYAEILEEADSGGAQSAPQSSHHVSTFFYARLPDAWVHIKTYTLYRLECGLRSSAILGFIGLPTLGFHLQSAFLQGRYSEVSALLIVFYTLIASIRVWARPRVVPLYLAIAPFALGGGALVSWENVVRFLTEDIVPAPLSAGAPLAELGEWTWELLIEQALPGMLNTLILTQIALVATGFIALITFPIISSQFFGRFGRTMGHILLVILRSTPELILAYIFLQLWGPSMLPAIVALALHNGAIIGHLIGRYTDDIQLRPDSPRGVNCYGYEIVPRIYGQFLAFLFYRWEIILRETAILGILGVATLGFYIDSAIQELRLDRAVFLILITALLNIGIDALSRRLRARLRLKAILERER